MNQIYIGFDPKESIAFHTLSHSILRHSSKPIAVIPINLANLSDCYHRGSDDRQSNEFSFSRFLVPYLSGYMGHAIYMDCDMLVTTDMSKLFDQLAETNKAVHVVKHDYKSSTKVKYLGQEQFNYPRKNWSSFVYWNCEHPRNSILTTDKIRDASAAYLHRFKWLDNEQIGELDPTWNFLVGEYEQSLELPKVLHWTLGGPYFNDFSSADYADLWNREKELALNCVQWK